MQLTQVKKLLLRVYNSFKELWSFRPKLFRPDLQHGYIRGDFRLSFDTIAAIAKKGSAI